jgi:hypothetical protein
LAILGYIFFMDAITIQKSDKGWIIELPDDFTQQIGVAKGSIAVLYGSNGKVKTEIIPPPSKKLRDISKRISAKYKDAFEEMKRVGD